MWIIGLDQKTIGYMSKMDANRKKLVYFFVASVQLIVFERFLI